MPDLVAADGDLVIRPLQDRGGDYERLAAWRNSAYVKEWWDPDDPPVTPALRRGRARARPRR